MTAVRSIVASLKELPRQTKVAIVALADYLVLNVAVFASYALRLSSFELPDQDRIYLYVSAPLISVACAFPLGIYWSVVRSYSNLLEKRILTSQLLAAGVWITVVFAAGTPGFARSTVLIYLLLAVGSMILLRKFAALVFGAGAEPQRHRVLTPALIYGAGQEGQLVLDAMRRNHVYRPVAFVDTDYTLVGRTIAGLKVFSPEELPDVMESKQPREVIVARSDLSRSSRRMLVDHLLAQGLVVKMMPRPDEFVDGQVKLGELRPIKVEDLLGRDPVPPDRILMEKIVKGQVVMVTGAGGSIGSELVRQVFAYGPRKLVLVDSSEFALFEIHRSIEAQVLAHRNQDCVLVPVLADIRDKDLMSSAIAAQSVDIVFHAAAYKHVRMVQENVAAGIDNNVFGTKAVVEAAIENGVRRFVMISTDKAVRPTSVMGASKRVAEMVIQALASGSAKSTVLAMVRFGNVLGSTGSVVPLFREQIAAGGPVRVTDPDVTRYFMLIPEAAQLVIQAGAMSEGGDVFVLDMGEPVRILNLANTMIELAGLSPKTADNPDGDIEIHFSGLRDGEKLYEELQIGRDVTYTSHPRIMRSREIFLDTKTLDRHLAELKSLMEDAPEMAAKKLMELAHYGAN